MVKHCTFSVYGILLREARILQWHPFFTSSDLNASDSLLPLPPPPQQGSNQGMFNDVFTIWYHIFSISKLSDVLLCLCEDPVLPSKCHSKSASSGQSLHTPTAPSIFHSPLLELQLIIIAINHYRNDFYTSVFKNRLQTTSLVYFLIQ